MFESLLTAVQDTTVATAIREGATLFPWIECLHVLAITIVLGSIAVVDLRLIGLRSRDRSVQRTLLDALPITWCAFAAAVVTGALLFASNATTYAHNIYFQAKLALIVLAGLNMAVFHFLLARDADAWHTTALTPLRARVAGMVSLGLWIAIAACGRWIGFTINALT